MITLRFPYKLKKTAELKCNISLDFVRTYTDMLQPCSVLLYLFLFPDYLFINLLLDDNVVSFDFIVVIISIILFIRSSISYRIENAVA